MKHDLADFRPLGLKRCGLFWRLLETAKRAAVLYLAAQLFVPPVIAQSSCMPVFQFAIFYNSLLEFTWCPHMTLNGRTHANGDIYTGSASQLTFNSLVSATGTISSPPWDGHAVSDYTVAATFNASYSTNCQALTLPIGTTNVHAIIEMPPPRDDTNSSLAQARYYNKTNLVLLVSNSTVTLTL